MSGSTTNLDTISSSQASKEVTANALFDATSPATLYGRRASTTSGLTFGYYGGTLNILGTLTAIANGTVVLTASQTNYVEVAPETGAVTNNTIGFTAGYIPLYTIVTDASSVTSYTDYRALLLSAQRGKAYGVASLGADGYVPLAELPPAIVGALQYQGVWNASTNTPALSSGVGTKGYYYKVSVAGTTSLDGHAVWTVDDVAIFDGTVWDIVQGGITAGEINSALGFTLLGTAAQTYTFPSTTATLARTDAGQTFTGTQDFIAPVKLSAGTVGAPAFYLSTYTTTGLYCIGANNLGVTISGAQVLDIASTGLTVTGAIDATAAYKYNGSNVITASTTLNNYFFGNAGNLTMTGSSNTASGWNALYSNTTGSSNTASGWNALYSNTTGSSNTASGVQALLSNTTGTYNTANGLNALYSNTTGYYNTASGWNTLYFNTTGSSNTASGLQALYSNTTGSSNTASGMQALYELGANQTAGAFVIGVVYTIQSIGTTDFTLIGAASNTVGVVFTATGVGSGTGTASPNVTGNTASGYNTGRGIISGSNNTIFGANIIGLDANLQSNIILAIGTGSIKAQYNGTNWSLSGALSTTTYLVANLPTGSAGMRSFVTDALAPTFGAAVAGSGAVGTPVYHDGTSWKVG